ncbi:MAG: hypothetical protein DWQ04_29340 [Chloroflexi bacterium]|nr:MAG: hypothetical protein DWQ04_29340 [Chloroflexota bacterium]
MTRSIYTKARIELLVMITSLLVITLCAISCKNFTSEESEEYEAPFFEERFGGAGFDVINGLMSTESIRLSNLSQFKHLTSTRVGKGFFVKGKNIWIDNNQGLPRIYISDIQDSGATISVVSAIGDDIKLSYGENTPDREVNEEVCTNGNNDIHTYVLDELEKETTYNFEVLVNEQKLDMGSMSSFETGKALPISAGNNLKGQVFQVDMESAAQCALVFTRIFRQTEGGGIRVYSSILSSVVAANGEWRYFLKNARTADLTKSFNYTDTDGVEIFVDGGQYGTRHLIYNPLRDLNVPVIYLPGNLIDIGWQSDCQSDPHLTVEVFGKGMGTDDTVTNPQYLSFADKVDMRFVLVQVVVKQGNGDARPDKVIITSDTEIHEIENPIFSRLDDPYTSVFAYEALLQSTRGIKAEVIKDGALDRNIPRAVIAYVFQQKADNYAYSGQLPQFHVYQQKRTVDISILPWLTERDTEVQFVVADVEDDHRKIDLIVQLPDVIDPIIQPAFAPTNGAELLISSIPLGAVSVNYDQFQVGVNSPEVNGDSVFWSGVNVKSLCPSE